MSVTSHFYLGAYVLLFCHVAIVIVFSTLYRLGVHHLLTLFVPWLLVIASSTLNAHTVYLISSFELANAALLVIRFENLHIFDCTQYSLRLYTFLKLFAIYHLSYGITYTVSWFKLELHWLRWSARCDEWKRSQTVHLLSLLALPFLTTAFNGAPLWRNLRHMPLRISIFLMPNSTPLPFKLAPRSLSTSISRYRQGHRRRKITFVDRGAAHPRRCSKYSRGNHYL